jgi:hypothetical protein
VAFRLGAIRLPWRRTDPGKDDPFWDHFINTPAADLANSVVEMIRRAPQGNVFPTKADIHTPEITSSHVKGMARYVGADLVGIARLNSSDAGDGDGLPFAVVCAVRADYDPRDAPGIGGQVPVQNGLFITFVLSAWIRELGFRATAVPNLGGEKLAAEAGLGKLDSAGRLVTRAYGSNVYVADVICTDLPLAADG